MQAAVSEGDVYAHKMWTISLSIRHHNFNLQDCLFRGPQWDLLSLSFHPTKVHFRLSRNQKENDNVRPESYLATMWLPLPISLMGKQSPRQRDPLAQVTQPDRPVDSMISHGSFTELNRGREKNNIRGCPPSPRQGAGCCHVFCLL